MDIKKYIGKQENNLNNLNECDYKQAVDFLVDDENEAIAGYDRIIQLFENSDEPNKDLIIKDLKKIKADEYEHIEILKSLEVYKNKYACDLIKQGMFTAKELHNGHHD